MSLTHDEVEEYLEIISTGSKITEVDSKVILLRYPTANIRMMSKFIYKTEYKLSVDEGMLTHSQMADIIKERNWVSETDRNQLSKLESQITAQRILLSKTTRVKANKERIKNIIQDLKLKKAVIENKERSKFAMTADTKAEEARILYLCYNSVFNVDNDSLYWATFDDFKKEYDYMFRQAVLTEFISFYTGISTTTIRALARSNLWRIKYVTSVKTGEDLFGVPVSNYTGDMLNLAYWSHYYQNINDMMSEDQPPEDIIEDDDALDAFMQDYHNERTKDIAERKHRKGNRGKLSAFNQEEVIVARTNELFEDIEFDEPREAAAIKDKALVNKKTRRR